MSDLAKIPSVVQVRNAAGKDDIAQLQTWIEQGLSPDTKLEGNVPLLHPMVECGAMQSVQMLLQMGADAEQQNQYGVTALRVAIEAHRPDMFHALIEHGCNPKRGLQSGQNYLHVAAMPFGQNGMEMVDRLLAEGVSLQQKDADGKMPKNVAGQGSYDFASRFMFRHELDEALANRKVDKSELEKTRKKPGLEEKYHQSWLEMPVTWAWMNRVLPQLEKKQETIRREDMDVDPKRLAWAVIGGSVPVLDAHLRAQGEQGIGLADFVTRNGAPTDTLKEVCRMWGEHKLLDMDWAKKLDAGEMRALYQAMPDFARERMPDYHQTLAVLRARQNSQERGR